MYIYNLNKTNIKIKFLLVLGFIFSFDCFSQNINTPILTKSNSRIEGIWENHERFIDFSIISDENKTIDSNLTNVVTSNSKNDFLYLNMRVVLKPYYKYFYKDEGVFKARIELPKKDERDHIIYLNIKYPFVKHMAIMPLVIDDNKLFSSFYARVKFKSSEDVLPDDYAPVGVPSEKLNYALGKHSSPLYGFWIERGSQNGILLYPEETPKSIDAYFFTDKDYIRFRYWIDDLAYSDKKAYLKGSDGISYEFPKLLKRGDFIYSCITSNGSILRNYETGTYKLNKKLSNGEYIITLKKQGAGIGLHSVADTYAHKNFSTMENMHLHIMCDNQVFSFGDPYLEKSKISNLDTLINEHNSKRRKVNRD